MLKFAVIAVIVLLGCAFAYVRFMPVSATKFHVDPETAAHPSIRGYVFVRDGEALPPVEFALSKPELARKVEGIILATPRTEKLTGDLATGFASYVTRSGLWGFPDIASVKIVETGEGQSQLLILSRQIYGIEDFGMNASRVKAWLTALTS